METTNQEPFKEFDVIKWLGWAFVVAALAEVGAAYLRKQTHHPGPVGDDMYRKFLRLTKSLTVSFEKVVNFLTTQEHNPLYFHGALPAPRERQVAGPDRQPLSPRPRTVIAGCRTTW